MQETEARLQREIEALLQQAEKVDEEEDARYGKGKSGDELPEELQRRESRLAVIRAAKAELEAEAKAKAEAEAQAAREKIAERERNEKETGKKLGGTPPRVPDPEQATPDPKAQKSFTDPESRIMKDGAMKSFEQAYNAQIAVGAERPCPPGPRRYSDALESYSNAAQLGPEQSAPLKALGRRAPGAARAPP